MKTMSTLDLAFKIGNGEVDANELLMKVFNEMPEAVLNVYLNQASSFINEIKRIYANGSGYVAAIKFHRDTTGAGLKEAKDAVDKIVGRV